LAFYQLSEALKRLAAGYTEVSELGIWWFSGSPRSSESGRVLRFRRRIYWATIAEEAASFLPRML